MNTAWKGTAPADHRRFSRRDSRKPVGPAAREVLGYNRVAGARERNTFARCGVSVV
jgi:hypothetical protein